MAAFLEAASSGRLRNEKEADEKVNDLFSEKTRQVTKRPESARSTPTARSAISARSPTKSKSETDNRPVQAWQVTKKHLDLSPQEISNLGQGDQIGNEDSANNNRELHHRMHKWTKPESGIFENRHKTQQQILKMQREQLKEQQKMIEDLKFLQTQQMLQQQLHQQQLQTYALNQAVVEKVPVKKVIKAPKPCDSEKKELTNGHLSHSSENETARSDSKSTSRSKVSVVSSRHDGFVRKMEERAAERARLKEERERRKREQEKEKLAQLEAEQEEQRQREEEEKMAKIEAKKEQKRLEKQRQMELQEYQERLKLLTSKADDFYRRSQLFYRGLLPWKQFVFQARERLRTARWRHESKVLRTYFQEWRRRTQESIEEKEIRSERFYETLIIKRCFTNWRKHKEDKAFVIRRAEAFYNRRLMWRVVRAWLDETTDQKLWRWKQERLAKDHDTVRLVKRAFLAWKRLPAVEAEERARNKRLSEMRSKVAAMLPDFQKSLDETAS